MFDIPETLIIVLSAALVVLATRHWISTISLDKSRTDIDSKGKVRSA
jgi:hypothetical protein